MAAVFRFSPKFYQRVMVLLILTVVFLTYAVCLTHDFVNWDDDVHLTENPALRSLDARHLKEIFTTTVNCTYIPLTILSFAFEYHFFGYDPLFYHLDNILLHLLVTALVIVFARRLGLSMVAAGLAGLIFGIHPLHVESVAWVTERKDVLYSVFYMLSLLVYLRYLDARRTKFLVVSIGLGVLSILAKPMALSLPFVLLLCDWYYAGRFSWRDIFNKFYYLAFLVPIAWVTYVSNAGVVEPHGWSGLLVWVWCFLFYLGKFFIPGETMLFYPLPFPVVLQNPSYLCHVIAFVAFCAVLWIWRKNRMFVFAVLFYAGSIFFLLRFNVIFDAVADRFMYLPSVGLCLFTAFGVEKLWLYSKRNILLFYGILIALAALLTAAVGKTQERALVWQDSVVLWSRQIAVNPVTGVWLSYTKLADAYAAQGNFPEALAAYQLAIDHKPDFADPYFGMANIYKRSIDTDAAVELYAQAIRYDPRHFQALYELARIYQSRGMASEAIAYDRRAVEVNPLNGRLYQDILTAYNDDPSGVYQVEKVRMQALLGNQE